MGHRTILPAGTRAVDTRDVVAGRAGNISCVDQRCTFGGKQSLCAADFFAKMPS